MFCIPHSSFLSNFEAFQSLRVPIAEPVLFHALYLSLWFYPVSRFSNKYDQLSQFISPTLNFIFSSVIHKSIWKFSLNLNKYPKLSIFRVVLTLPHRRSSHFFSSLFHFGKKDQLLILNHWKSSLIPVYPLSPLRPSHRCSHLHSDWNLQSGLDSCHPHDYALHTEQTWCFKTSTRSSHSCA